MKLESTAKAFRERAPEVEYWWLMLVDDRFEALSVRQNVLQPVNNWRNGGAMIAVHDRGGMGYGATSDLTPAGLAEAAARATEWAHRTAARSLVDPAILPRVAQEGRYSRHGERPWSGMSLSDKIALLQGANRTLKAGARIVDWSAHLVHLARERLLIASVGARLEQDFECIGGILSAAANDGSETQNRTHGEDLFRQGGLEQLEATGFPGEAERVAAEALQLLDAPDCPSGTMDLLAMPGQMVLQVHESIGHPLELDRILGDERNYAGTSFVTPEMIGTYRYGSPLLNVTFDPAREGELASYRFDDEGTPAAREYVIRGGILERTLGGAVSQARSGLPGVANSRASNWNRPPIDRMANLNLEPGDKSLAELIGSVERGVWMDTNRSWSIDDSRNKFQFGCEVGRLIEDGELKGIGKNPNYRGISATFWRSLDGVGDASTHEVRGLWTCGKGEPNQAIQVGHAAPACVFRGVDVFGSE